MSSNFLPARFGCGCEGDHAARRSYRSSAGAGSLFRFADSPTGAFDLITSWLEKHYFCEPNTGRGGVRFGTWGIDVLLRILLGEGREDVVVSFQADFPTGRPFR